MWYDRGTVDVKIEREPFCNYRWEPTGEHVSIPCVNCGGEYEHLRVKPDRSPAYLRTICLCKSCKGIFGWPRQPDLDKVAA